MGQAISSLIDGSSGEEKQQLDDALNSLRDLAETKMDNFYTSIENSASDTLLLPIKRITTKTSFLMARASTDTSGLQKQISGLITDFAGGDWVGAISSAAADIITDLLGSSSASVQEKQT